MSGVLDMLEQPGEELESKLGPVVDVTGFGVGDSGCHGHNGLDNAEGGGRILLDRGVLYAIGFNILVEAPFR